MQEERLFKFDKGNSHTQFIIFVSKAAQRATKGNYRTQLEKIMCDGKRIVSTDGHRLNMYTPEECPIPEGFYTIEKQNKSCIYISSSDDYIPPAPYPDIDRVIPEKIDLTEFNAIDKNVMFAEICRKMGSGSINIDYFLSAISVGGVESFKIKDSLSPVALYGDFTTSIIMPIR